MNIVEQRKSISSLYVLKAICAFLVVIIHFPMKYGYYFYPIVRIAVPCFFMISGYFLYSDNREKLISNLKRALRKTLQVTIWAYAFYFLVELFLFLIFKNNTLDIPSHTLLYYIVAGPSIGGSSHLWYLIAYIETLIIALICARTSTIKVLWWLFPIGLILNLLIGKYSFILPPIDFSVVGLPKYIAARNFITIGIPAFAVGLFLRKNITLIQQRFTAQKIWIATVVFLMLAIIEFAFLEVQYGRENTGDISFFTIPLTVCLVLLCLQYPSFGAGSYFSTIGRKYSTDIYIYHMFGGNFLVGYIGAIIYKITGIETLALYNAPTVFVATLIFVIVWQRCVEWAKMKTSKIFAAIAR